MEFGYKNLGYCFLVLLLFVFLGFYKTYFGLIPNFNPATTWVVHFHASYSVFVGLHRNHPTASHPLW